MVHLTARVAWHDNKWNGAICRDPEKNVHCRGNYSLISPRIQRRINLELEQKYKTQDVSQIVEKEGSYVEC